MNRGVNCIVCCESRVFVFVTSGCVIRWNWIDSIASQRCFRSHRVHSVTYCSSVLSLVMARRPDVVQRPCGSNSLPSSSIQGLILHILHKMAKHPPLVIPTWQGELNYMHQIFWSMLIYDKLAPICHHPCFDTAIRSRETARKKANFTHLLKNAKC